MDDSVPFGSGMWFLCLGLLVFGRGMDLLSTRLATPNLILEANPIARRLGWKWGPAFNLLICLATASSPFGSVILTTTSLLVAAHNFHSAWVMRALGEADYTAFMSAQFARTPKSVYLGCLVAETGLVGLLGAALVYFGGDELVPVGIGIGMICYAGVVLFFSLLSVWRIRWRMG